MLFSKSIPQHPSPPRALGGWNRLIWEFLLPRVLPSATGWVQDDPNYQTQLTKNRKIIMFCLILSFPEPDMLDRSDRGTAAACCWCERASESISNIAESRRTTVIYCYPDSLKNKFHMFCLKNMFFRVPRPGLVDRPWQSRRLCTSTIAAPRAHWEPLMASRALRSGISSK